MQMHFCFVQKNLADLQFFIEQFKNLSDEALDIDEDNPVDDEEW